MGAQTKELWMLGIDQFECENANRRRTIVCYPRVGSRRGGWKNQGWHKVPKLQITKDAYS